jgi:hypothetical protein
MMVRPHFVHSALPRDMVEAADAERKRQAEENKAAIALLRSWYEVDEEGVAEQRETLALLMQALDEDRPSDQKLFP